jgi:ferredoxin
LGQALTAAGTAIAAPSLLNQATAAQEGRSAQSPEGEMAVKLTVNGEPRSLTIEPRVTLLDALRERMELTGSKKGCDHGQCGACTVLIDGQRAYSCLTLAVMQEGKQIVTIEGLAKGDVSIQCRRRSSITMAFNAAIVRQGRFARRLPYSMKSNEVVLAPLRQISAVPRNWLDSLRLKSKSDSAAISVGAALTTVSLQPCSRQPDKHLPLLPQR